MRKLKIGTRGSKLALWQAEWVRRELQKERPHVSSELIVIRTESDRQPDAPITSMDSRGVFTRDIEVALLTGKIDLAVHSLKDLPSEDSPGLIIAATSPREDARDVLVSRAGEGLEGLPGGAVVGTSSLRRCSLVKAARADVSVRPIRGNIETRLRKLRGGEYDAIVIAAAAINRLDLDLRPQFLDPDTWVPAVAQGIIGVQARADDGELRDMLATISDPESWLCARVERSFLRSLGGGCSVPVGGLATTDGESVTLRGFVGAPDGTQTLRLQGTAPINAADGLGVQVATGLVAGGGGRILEALRERVPLLRES